MLDSPELGNPKLELDEHTNPLDMDAVKETARIAKAENYRKMFERVQKGALSIADASKKLADIDMAKDDQLREFRAERNELGEEVLKDPLTKLFNTRWYQSELKVRAAEANAFPEKKLTLLFFDIDFFKRINTQYGHPLGDEIIKAIASLSREDEPIARIGGEEFVQLVDLSSVRAGEEISDFDKLKSIRDRYAEKVKEVTFAILKDAPLIKEPEDGVRAEHATLSIGATQYIEGEDTDVFHARANTAMHTSKNNGRDQLTFTEREGTVLQYPIPAAE